MGLDARLYARKEIARKNSPDIGIEYTSHQELHDYELSYFSENWYLHICIQEIFWNGNDIDGVDIFLTHGWLNRIIEEFVKIDKDHNKINKNLCDMYDVKIEDYIFENIHEAIPKLKNISKWWGEHPDLYLFYRASI